MESSTGLRLLSLDGGGIRGLSELVILEAIMMRVQDLLHLDEVPRPAHYFDMIGGTSTGGLIAIMLGRLQMTVAEAMSEYGNLSQKIFGTKRSKFKDGKFSAEGFKKVIKAVVSKELGDEDAKLLAAQDSPCKAFVCTVAARSVPHPRLFRSYRRPGVSEYECAIWEAARATCAAPTYFERVMIGPDGRQEEFFDGGLGCNNPIKELHLEAEAMFNPETPVSCILSLGTGVRNPIEVKRPNSFFEKAVPINLVNGFKKMALSSEQYELDMEKKYADIDGLYYRLNVGHGLQSTKLADWEDLPLVQTRTHDYLQSHDVSRKIEAIAMALIGRSTQHDPAHYTLGHLSMSTKNVINAVRGASEKASIFGSYQASTFSIDQTPETIIRSWLTKGNRNTQDAASDRDVNLEKRFCNDATGYQSGQWLFETPQWQSFERPESQNLLWLQGPPGCGKSVLSAVIINELQTRGQEQNSAVLYHFCHQDHGSTTSLDIVRSLLLQCVDIMSKEIMASLCHISNKKPELDHADQRVEKGLWSTLSEIIQQNDRKVYIVLDGADELKSNASPLGKILSLMRSPQKKASISLLLSSRFDFDVADAMKEMDGVAYSQVNVNGDLLRQDMLEYVTFRVSNKGSRLRQKNLDTRNYIIEKVCQKAQSSFLYASLVLNELEGGKVSTRADINKTLENLPSKLSEAYMSHLETPKNSDKGREVFQWLSCAKRHMSWSEIASALSIVDGKISEEDLVDDTCEVFVQDHCGYLVEIFGDDRDKIRFIHSTVRDLLVENEGPGEDLGINQAHSLIALKLLSFLQNEEPPSFYPEMSLAENREKVTEYVKQPGFGIYSYAVLNWFFHVARCEEDFQEEVEQELCTFLSSESCISWLKGALFISMLTGHSGDSTALTADVVECLETWIRARPSEDELETTLFIRSWIDDFLGLMQDWGRALEHSPFWIHFIPQQFLHSENCFQEALELTADQVVIQMTEGTIRTARTNPAPWQQKCFSIDKTRNLAYTWNQDAAQLSCYHMNTGLLAAQMKLVAGAENLAGYELVSGTQCPQHRFMALLFREVSSPAQNDISFVQIRSGLQPTSQVFDDKMAWVMQNETCIEELFVLPILIGIPGCRSLVCVLELSHDGSMRTSLFGYPRWSIQPPYTSHYQWIRWEADDINILTFSPDSSLLATPTGIISLDTGIEKNHLPLCSDLEITGAVITQDFETLAIVRKWNTLEFLKLSEPFGTSVSHSREFQGIIHILGVSNSGRFSLVLQLQDYVHPDGATPRPRNRFLQHGHIGVYDKKKKLWTPLLESKPPASRKISSWDFRQHHVFTKFSSESPKIFKANKVVLQSPKGWQPDECVRVTADCSPSKMLRDKCIVAFESQSMMEGFGAHPSLVFVEQTADFEVSIPKVLYADLVLGTWSPTQYRQSFPSAATFSMNREKQDLSSHFPYIDRNKSSVEFVPALSGESVYLVLFSSPEGDACRLHMQIVHDTESTVRLVDGAAGPDDVARSPVYDVLLNHDNPTKHYSGARRSVTKFRLANNALPLDLQNLTLHEDLLTVGASVIRINSMRSGEKASDLNQAQDLLSDLVNGFQHSSRPLAGLPSSDRSQIDSSPIYTIFSRQDVQIVRSQTDSSAVGHHSEIDTKSFLLSNVTAVDKERYFMQFSKAMEHSQDSSDLQEAVQYEIYLCIYNSKLKQVSWCVHTTSAGEIQRLPSYIPTAVWALHPTHPLLFWTLPGHALRVSHVESNSPPVNVGDSFMVDNEALEAIKFSPNGRFVSLRVSSTMKNDIFGDNIPKEKVMALVVLDLLLGTNTLLGLPPKLTFSHDLTDTCLNLYHLTVSGAVQVDSFFLPDLIAFDRHILTFIPDQCCCMTCGRPLSDSSYIAVKETKGVKKITLCHSPVPFGRTRAAGQTCEPLILGVASPELPVELSDTQDSLLLSRRVKAFHALITKSGECQMPVFTAHEKFSLSMVARVESVQPDSPESPSLISQTHLRKSGHVDSGAQGSNELGSEYDWRPDYEQARQDLIFSETHMDAIKNSGIMGHLHDEYGDFFPATWDEMTEMVAEMANSDDPMFDGWVQTLFNDAGVGCSVPILLHTFHFDEPKSTHDARDSTFTWSRAVDVGWIEERTETLMRRIWSNQLANARIWYDYEKFSGQPVVPFMTQEGAKKEGKQKDEGREEAKSTNVSANLITEFSKMLEKEMDLSDPSDQEASQMMVKGAGMMSSFHRFLDDMEHMVPGLGRVFRSRIMQFTSQSLMGGAYMEIED